MARKITLSTELPTGYMKKNFLFVRAFDWNADSSVIAFIRFDESKVKQVTLPLYESGNNYPKLISYKYPKAGEENAKVSVHYYNLNTQKRKMFIWIIIKILCAEDLF